MRLRAITCESLARPVYACAAISPHLVDVELVPRHLHQPEEIRQRLQQLISATTTQDYDAITLVFGLCGQTTAGLQAVSMPLVIPKAHDCITLYLGSRSRYNEEISKEPGTYWYARDYMERSSGSLAALIMGTTTDHDVQTLYDHYIRKYGQPKADRLMEVMDQWRSHYKRSVYLDTGLGDAPDLEQQALTEAARRGWSHERLQADLNLLSRLLNAEWDDDFLVVPPGKKIGMSYDDQVIQVE